MEVAKFPLMMTEDNLQICCMYGDPVEAKRPSDWFINMFVLLGPDLGRVLSSGYLALGRHPTHLHVGWKACRYRRRGLFGGRLVRTTSTCTTDSASARADLELLAVPTGNVLCQADNVMSPQPSTAVSSIKRTVQCLGDATWQVHKMTMVDRQPSRYSTYRSAYYWTIHLLGDSHLRRRCRIGHHLSHTTLGPSRLTSARTGTTRYQPIRDTGGHREGRIHTPRLKSQQSLLYPPSCYRRSK